MDFSLPRPRALSRLVPSIPGSVAVLWRHATNRWVGFHERRRGYPSTRALSEFLDYYAGLYQDRGPDPRAFAALLRRNGRPFLANPFPEGNPDHYLYHPGGLVLADLEAVLSGVARKWRAPLASRSPEPPADASAPPWPTLEQAQVAQQRHASGVEAGWALDAGVCWGLVLMEAGSLDWLRVRVHPDNLAWATVEALRHSPWGRWGVNPRRVLSAALDKGVLSPQVASAWFPEWVPGRPA